VLRCPHSAPSRLLRRTIPVAICFLAALAVTPSQGPAVGGAYNHFDSEFCDSTTVRGNAAELERLPPLRRPPTSGRLPFLPNTLRFSANDAFQVDEGTLGFSLRQSDGHRTEELGVTANTMLMRIDRRGEMLEPVGRFQERLSTLKGFETFPISFEVDKPGLYRAKVVFEDDSGKLLAHYGAYFRLLRLVLHPPRLALNTRSLRPGQMVFGRVENFGTTSISYGAPYSIERWDGSTWITAPESPRGPWKRLLYVTRSGGTGACSTFQIPDTMQPGTYRMVKPIRSGTDGPLMARFEIRTPV
jgi:hypothetical protein